MGARATLIAAYAESSAVLRWLLGADDGPAIRVILGGAERVISSGLTSAEVGRALHQLTARGSIDPEARDRTLARYHAAAARWTLYAVTGELLARVAERFPAEPLRTLDAIHVATAAFHAREVEAVTVVSTDARVVANARALGLPVLPRGG
jgi:predicted nucleic acid-binding protein